jgi:hypothetical protein
MENKVGNHELKAEVVGLNAKLDEWYKDINKKVSYCAQQRDLSAIMN